MPQEILEDLVTVDFEKLLSGEEVFEMLTYLHVKKGYVFNGSFSGRFEIGQRFEDPEEKSPLYPEAYPTEIKGRVSRKDSLFPATSFSFEQKSNSEKRGYFDSFRFFTTPGYEVIELPKDEVGLIRELRKDIENYLLKFAEELPEEDLELDDDDLE